MRESIELSLDGRSWVAVIGEIHRAMKGHEGFSVPLNSSSKGACLSLCIPSRDHFWTNDSLQEVYLQTEDIVDLVVSAGRCVAVVTISTTEGLLIVMKCVSLSSLVLKVPNLHMQSREVPGVLSPFLIFRLA